MPDPDALRPDRYYVLSDAGSVYWDDTCPDGFGTPDAAAEWARRQTQWEYGSELDFSDGVTSVIVLGSEVNAADAVWQEWADAGGDGPYPDVSVRNHAIDLGLVDETGGSSGENEVRDC
jgi:hypothetical protein